jgi:hypothetical protein
MPVRTKKKRAGRKAPLQFSSTTIKTIIERDKPVLVAMLFYEWI